MYVCVCVCVYVCVCVCVCVYVCVCVCACVCHTEFGSYAIVDREVIYVVPPTLSLTKLVVALNICVC